MDYYEMKDAVRAVIAQHTTHRRRNPFKGQNFMTPEQHGAWLVGDHVVEVSSGTGISGGYIYGVTVADRNGEKQDELCCCCGDLDELNATLADLNA